MERFVGANSAEITRADSKAAVLLGFTGAVLGVFLTVTRSNETGQTLSTWSAHAMWWAPVVSTLLAIVCFVCAITPRRHGRRYRNTAAPGYFEHITREFGSERLHRAFERVGRDPTDPLLSSLMRTSEIVRIKYRWVEAGTVLLLVSLPQFAVTLRPV